MRLGAVFAGGRSRRFGADKAVATIAGRPMLDWVIGRLRPQVDEVAVVGRDWPGCARIDDRLPGGQGPLAALAGALAWAAAHGFEDVLTSGCDLPDLPADLETRLSPGPAVSLGQPLLGLWPASFGPALDAYLASTPRRSMHGWIEASGARSVACGSFANINEAGDLAAYLKASADPQSSP